MMENSAAAGAYAVATVNFTALSRNARTACGVGQSGALWSRGPTITARRPMPMSLAPA